MNFMHLIVTVYQYQSPFQFCSKILALASNVYGFGNRAQSRKETRGCVVCVVLACSYSEAKHKHILFFPFTISLFIF